MTDKPIWVIRAPGICARMMHRISIDNLVPDDCFRFDAAYRVGDNTYREMKYLCRTMAL